MSKIEVDKIDPQSGTDLELGTSGDTITIPAGVTFDSSAATTTLPDGSVTNDQLVNDNITINGSSVSLGGSTTIETGTSWQSVVTAATLTAVAGRGYPINTTSNACTVTLPSSASVGDQVQIVDYAGTFATNNIRLTSSLNINGGTNDKILTTNREGITITYADATQGWVATSGVNSGDQALDPLPPYSVDFLVIAGGASGGAGWQSGGGGAGGYRNSYSTESSGGGGGSETSLTFVPETVYTITIGAGGASQTTVDLRGNNGIDSSISGTGITTITSSGGGAGGGESQTAGLSGGSGGGAARINGSGTGGSGTANQGYAGGSTTTSYSDPYSAGGGGGAGAVGTSTSGSTIGFGGNGLASSITGSSVTRAGGGGGGQSSVSTVPSGGTGGGGTGGNGNSTAATAGTVNTGSGGGGSGHETAFSGDSGAGGSGVVILSMLDADYSGNTTGSPTVATGVSGNTVLTFNGDGSYTA